MGLMLEAPHRLQMYEFFDTPIVFQKAVEQYSHLPPLLLLPSLLTVFEHHSGNYRLEETFFAGYITFHSEKMNFSFQLWFCIWFSL